MRQVIVWARLFGVSGAVVETVELDESLGAAVARVRVRRGQRRRCGVCGRRCSLYDQGEGRRQWRALDLGTTMAFVEADAPRVSCPEHGVVVARVPWARHDSRFTKDFEEQCAWLAVHVSKTTLAELVRVTWRTVGRIIGRVVEERSGEVDSLEGLRKIGIDEVSFRRGQRYLTVVVDHETARVVWVQEGRDEATLERFFDRLGPKRAAALRFVTADGAVWIKNVLERRCPQAKVCLDPFHVVSWATDALDQVRRAVWNEARRSGQTSLARELKGVRYALWKNPADLTRRQTAKLADIARINKPLYRAYLLKEHLREVFRLPFPAAVALLDHWLAWARRSRLAPFVRLARSIRSHQATIVSTLQYGLSNARVESVNTRIRLLTRIAFGFHSSHPLIAMVLLALGGLCPALPGRL
ncbi:MAG TPA: ISL3 family transposase [Labilithrix sp.]|nr:ISL3 family transposase [Labilithrix sp.]